MVGFFAQSQVHKEMQLSITMFYLASNAYIFYSISFIKYGLS